MRGDKQWPQCTTHCCDCGLGTITIDEWYMVNDDVSEQAWAGRRKSWQRRVLDGVVDVVPGTEILCIGCLEKRIGRTLCRTDFTDAPVNNPNEHQHSDRLRDRLTTDVSRLRVNSLGDLFQFLTERMIAGLPAEQKAALRKDLRDLLALQDPAP
jgi:hypothetical protein